MKLPKVKKLFRDPFFYMIAAVILVPGLLFAYGLRTSTRQTASINNLPAVESSNTETSSQNQSDPTDPQPITQAEQAVAVEKAPKAEPAAPAAPVCDQAKKQAAEDTKNSQTTSENQYHERQKSRLRVISTVYRKYMDEEIARHNNALNQIDATYSAAIAAANCS